MKLHTTLACIAVMSAPCLSFANGPIDGSVYGKINLSLDMVEFDDNVGASTPLDEWQINSNASRFGFKGETPLDGGLSVVYQVEWQVDVDGSNTDLTARNRFIGLSGDFGSIIAGRNDTPTKMAQNKIDLFNDYLGDIANAFEGENRSRNIAIYSTPTFGIFSGQVAFIPGEDTAGGNDGLSDGISAAGMVEIEDLYLALAIDRDVDGQDLERIVAQWNLGDFQIGGMLQQNQDEADTIDETGIFASVSYTLGNNIFKGQLGQVDNDASGRTFSEEETFSVGYDRKLGKNTTLFAYLTRNTDSVSGGAEEELTVVGGGIEHKF